jgi:cytosine deaminase
MRQCFEAVTSTPARILGLPGYGLDVGCNADLVVLQARNPVEAIRLRATRLHVIRQGRIVAQTPPSVAALTLPGRPGSVSFLC